MSNLKGRVALVTGGSRGMGAAIGRRLAQDGADVALTYVKGGDRARAVASQIEGAGRRALAIAADSADVGALRRAVDEVVEKLGRLDILVNNAGIFDAKPLEAVPVDAFDRMISVNTRAPFVAAQAAAAHMGEGGRIITIGSNLAERVPGPGMTLYSLSKAALVGLTKGWRGTSARVALRSTSSIRARPTPT